jgi:hypothetical protein
MGVCNLWSLRATRAWSATTRRDGVDVDSVGLTNVVSRLNRGLDIGGQSIGAPTGFMSA